MVIDVIQSSAEMKNAFQIYYNGVQRYNAMTPFMSIEGAFGVDKLREIKMYDLNNNEIYKTNYNYIANRIEEFIPLKYIATNSQRFNQYMITDSNGNEKFSVYFEMQEIFKGSYIIKMNDRILNCYEIEDGYAVHFPIYDGDKQVGEILKYQFRTDGKDTYRAYLFDEYQELSDAISMLILYLDRMKYNSSYISCKGTEFTYSKSYSKVNAYYNPEWILSNFDATAYFNNMESQIRAIKDETKKKAKKILTIIGIGWGITILIVLIILMSVFSNAS